MFEHTKHLKDLNICFCANLTGKKIRGNFFADQSQEYSANFLGVSSQNTQPFLSIYQVIKMPLRPPFQSAPSTFEGEAAPSKLIVPALEAAQCTLKTLQSKKKKELKRWASFKRQADRRGILVTIPEQHYMRIVNQPCVYCGVV